MNLTVDASIVVKWFFAESHCRESRLLLERQIRLHAPGLLLPEFANTVWKKARRREIADPKPFLDEIASLAGLITFYRAARLTKRASQIAVRIDHPAYDCMYAACAEMAGAPLITADKRLADKLGHGKWNSRVLYIGDSDTVRMIEEAGVRA